MRASSYFFITLGVILLSFASESIVPVFVIPFCLLIGYMIFGMLDAQRSFEWTAFSSMFSLLILITGVSQTYALLNFGELLTTIDANTYYKFSIGNKPLIPMEELVILTNAPLPVKIWSSVYRFFQQQNILISPWMGIMINTIMVAMSASVSVAIGRKLYGDDKRKLSYILRFFMFSGLIWIFGALHIRDAFALILNTLILYAIVLVWKTHKTRAVVLGLIIMMGSTWIMGYVRIEFVPIMMVLSSSIPIILFFSKGVSKSLKFSVVLVGIILLGINYSAISQFGNTINEQGTELRESYADLGKKESSGGSLGKTLLLNQPLAIRVVIGSVNLFLQPIPVWVNFTPQLGEYHWMKSANGVFQYVLIIMIYFSALAVLKKVIRGDYNSGNLFLIGYLLVTTLVVSLTSLEIRHHGQFYSGYFLLAADCNMPRRKIIEKSLLLFVGLHLTYLIVKWL